MFLDRLFQNIRTGKVIKHLKENSVVCDLGCRNDAGFLNKISDRISRGFGFDIEGGQSNNAKIEIRKLDLNNGRVSLDDNSVDMVTMLAVLEHLDSSTNAFKEAFRILKSGGKFILTTPSKRSEKILNFLASMNLINKEDIAGHKKYYLPEEIVKSLGEFKRVNWEYFEFGLNILVIAEK